MFYYLLSNIKVNTIIDLFKLGGFAPLLLCVKKQNESWIV